LQQQGREASRVLPLEQLVLGCTAVLWAESLLEHLAYFDNIT
jgi:hypothetical protein